MTKFGKKVVLALVGVMTVGLLGGCGNSFDAAKYTQALLDNSYKNDSTEFVNMKVGTAEEAAEIYEQGIDAEMDAMLATLELTEEQEAEYRTLFADILSQAKYTVGEATKQDDGSYVVTVSYEQMNIFEPAMTAYMEDITALVTEIAEGQTTMTEEEMTVRVVDSFKTCLEEAKENATYDEPAEATVRIQLEDKLWTANIEDLQNLETVFFDTVDANNALVQ